MEAHDHLLLGKVGRYLNEPLKARVIDELRPKTKVPNEKSNGKPSIESAGQTRGRQGEEQRKAKVKCAIATPKRRQTPSGEGQTGRRRGITTAA